MPVNTFPSLPMSHRIPPVIVMTVAFASLSVLVGCDSNGTPDPQDPPQIARVAISPTTATMGTGDQVEFSALALNEAGDVVEMPEGSIEWEWISSDPDVFTVEDDGTATAQSPGEAYCIIDATLLNRSSASAAIDDLEASAGFVGRDSAFVMVF